MLQLPRSHNDQLYENIWSFFSTEIILTRDIERTGAERALNTNVKQLSAAKGERIELSKLVHVPLAATAFTRYTKVACARHMPERGKQSR